MHTIPSVTVEVVPDPIPQGLAVLDVREPVEWLHGHIIGAQHIPLGQVPDRLADLPADRRVLVVCRVGARSGRAVGYLVQNGIDAVNLDGGMVEWAAAGRPMTSESGMPAQVV